MDLTVALVTDLHFGPEARFAGKLRKLTAHAGDLARAFVERMNREVHPDLVVNLGHGMRMLWPGRRSLQHANGRPPASFARQEFVCLCPSNGEAFPPTDERFRI